MVGFHNLIMQVGSRLKAKWSWLIWSICIEWTQYWVLFYFVNRASPSSNSSVTPSALDVKVLCLAAVLILLWAAATFFLFWFSFPLVVKRLFTASSQPNVPRLSMNSAVQDQYNFLVWLVKQSAIPLFFDLSSGVPLSYCRSGMKA